VQPLKSSSIGFETLTWIPFTTLNTRSFQILDVLSSRANGLKILTPQKYPRSTFELKHGLSFLSFDFPYLSVANFTWATMLMIKTSKWGNVTSMVLD
jgi:hypothetical protein